MPKFAANLSMMFTEVPFLDRFAEAAKHGFTAVEYLFPYDWPAADIEQRLRDNGLQQVLFNAPAGDWERGDRGLAALAGREEEFRASLGTAFEYANTLGCPQVHIMAGNTVATEDAQSRYLANLSYAIEQAESAGVGITIEPINPRDMPEYFLSDINQGVDIIRALDNSSLRLQFDFYHAQIIHGDVTTLFQAVLPFVSHVQIASVPERNEPETGELNYPYIFDVIDQSSYRGWVGSEYRPAGRTADGLEWFQHASAR